MKGFGRQQVDITCSSFSCNGTFFIDANCDLSIPLTTKIGNELLCDYLTVDGDISGNVGNFDTLMTSQIYFGNVLGNVTCDAPNLPTYVNSLTYNVLPTDTTLLVSAPGGVPSVGQQKGPTIGPLGGPGFGGPVAISSNGNTIAYYSVGGFSPGFVSVYDWNGSNWIQRGASINVNPFILSADPLVLSNDGNTFVYGRNFASACFVYDWSGSAWVQRGSDIVTPTQGGNSVAISDNKNTICVGIYNSVALNMNAGAVGVYDWTGFSWVLRGGYIQGDVDNTFWGNQVSMSDDGLTFVASGWAGSNLKAYLWNGVSWIQKGNTISNTGTTSISMSSNGQTFANLVNNAVTVYDYVGSIWVPRGSSINIVGPYSASQSLSLTSNGNQFAVADVGLFKTLIYEWNGFAWINTASFNETGDNRYCAISDTNTVVSCLLPSSVKCYEWSTTVVVLTLPNASDMPGRELIIRAINVTNSDANNVVHPLVSLTPVNTIIAYGQTWIKLQSDGSNWVSIMEK